MPINEIKDTTVVINLLVSINDSTKTAPANIAITAANAVNALNELKSKVTPFIKATIPPKDNNNTDIAPTLFARSLKSIFLNINITPAIKYNDADIATIIKAIPAICLNVPDRSDISPIKLMNAVTTPIKAPTISPPLINVPASISAYTFITFANIINDNDKPRKYPTAAVEADPALLTANIINTNALNNGNIAKNPLANVFASKLANFSIELTSINNEAENNTDRILNEDPKPVVIGKDPYGTPILGEPLITEKIPGPKELLYSSTNATDFGFSESDVPSSEKSNVLDKKDIDLKTEYALAEKEIISSIQGKTISLEFELIYS